MTTVVGDNNCKKDLGVCELEDDCQSKCSKIHKNGQGICERNKNGVGANNSCTFCYNLG